MEGHEWQPTAPRKRDAPRIRARLQRVALAAELFALGVGAVGIWQARAAGEDISRPVAIAFWAGLVGLLVSVVAPRVRARFAARHREPSDEVGD